MGVRVVGLGGGMVPGSSYGRMLNLGDSGGGVHGIVVLQGL